jgi:hypothetical protein
LLGPGSAFGRGKKGEKERRLRPLIGAGARKKRAGIEAGAKISPATVSSEEETVGGDDTDGWVPTVSENN